MHTNLAHEITGEITAKELAKREKVSVRAIGIPYAKLRAQDHPLFASQFDQNAPLSPEQIAILRPGKMTAKKSAPKKEISAATFAAPVAMTPEQGRPNEAAPQRIKQAKNWLKIAVLTGLALIVVGHSFLIWYDMFWLWKIPGAIGGGVVFLFILTGMGLMSEGGEDVAQERENMLWAVTLLEALAIVVHQAVFYRNAGEAFVAGLGLGYTWALAAVVCGCSIGATVFYQKVICRL